MREDLPPGVVAWVHAMLAKDPAARPASAADAWDRLEGEVADELGPRWRRAAALPEAGDTWGYVSVVTTAAPDVPPAAPLPAAPEAPAGAAAAALDGAEGGRAGGALAGGRCRAPPDPSPRPRRPPRALALAVIAATLVLAGAAGLSLFTGHEPPAEAAPAPKGPSLAERARHDLDPAPARQPAGHGRADGARPGSDPGAALERADAALATTRTALASAGVPAARSALRAQVSYLRAVGDTLRLDTDLAQLERLGGLSGRLVSRLERVEPLVPQASASVGGAKQLKAWATAELAPPPAAAAPVPAAPAAAPAATPAQTATPMAAPSRPRPDGHADAGATPPRPRRSPPPHRRPRTILAAPAYGRDLRALAE